MISFLLDNIRSDDALSQAKGEAFLAENPDPGVRQRPADMFRRAMNTGQAIKIVEAAKLSSAVSQHGSGGGEPPPDLASPNDEYPFRGISLIFQYDPGNSWPVFYEIGTMRVTSTGYGLQVFLALWHLFQIYLEDDATQDEIFAVVTRGSASQHNLTHHVGMAPWLPPDLLSLLRREAGVHFDPEKPVLLANLQTIRLAFDSLRALHIEGNRFRTPKGDGEIVVAMLWFTPSLLQEGP